MGVSGELHDAEDPEQDDDDDRNDHVEDVHAERVDGSLLHLRATLVVGS
jgi:hypothetical protein